MRVSHYISKINKSKSKSRNFWFRLEKLSQDYTTFEKVRVKPLFFHDHAEDLTTDSQEFGSWRWAKSCSTSFMTVQTGVKNRCRTTSSWSLWTRKLDAKFISRFMYRETCQLVFMKECVESRNDFRQTVGSQDINQFWWVTNRSQDFLKRENPQRQFLMGLVITAFWSQSWNYETRMQNGVSQHVHLWTSVGESYSTAANARIDESSGVASWRILFAMIERKSWHDPESHFTDAGTTRYCELSEWFKRMSRCGIDLQKKNFARSQSSGSYSMPSCFVEPATEACRAFIPSPRARSSRDRSLRLATWNSSGMHGNARSIFDPSHRGALHSLSQNPTSGIPLQVNSGQPETGSDEHFWNIRPILKRRPSTMSSFPTVGIPRHSMTEQRLQTSEPQFDKFPNPSTFLCCQKDSGPRFANVPIFPQRQCYGWKKRRWSTQCRTWHHPSISIKGEDSPNIEMLDARIASALNKIIQNPFFIKKISLEEQKAQRKTDRFRNLRQLQGDWCSWSSTWLC